MAEVLESDLVTASGQRDCESCTSTDRPLKQPLRRELSLDRTATFTWIATEHAQQPRSTHARDLELTPLVPANHRPDQSATQTIKIAAGSPADLITRLKRTVLGRLYQSYFKRFTSARRLVGFVVGKGYPAYLKLVHARLSNRQQVRWRPLCSLREYVQEHDLKTTQLAEATVVPMGVPKVVPAEDRNCLAAPSDTYTFPSIDVAEVPQATVYGGSNLVLADDKAICHDLYNFECDYTTEECHRRAFIHARSRQIRWMNHDDEPVQVSEAATFVDGCAHNYAHWLTEVLPRIAAFCEVPEYANIPIIINADLHENLLESLDFIAGQERQRILLPPGRAVCAEKLYLTSVTGYVPFQNRNASKPSNVHGKFSPFALGLVRTKILSALEDQAANSLPDKIYLRRVSGIRAISNLDEIEAMLESFGFVAVEPEKLSFRAQVQLFRQAKAIVAPTGAAIASALFCTPQARLCVLMAKHDQMIYRYWANMLMPLGIDVAYVLGKQTGKLDLGIHADYAVAPDHLGELLASWRAA